VPEPHYPAPMRSLRVEVDGRTLTFDGSRPLTVGRAAGADVVLPAMSVSRAHAELRPTASGWLLVDGGGQGGTFVAGQRISQLTLTGRSVVQCGPEGPGSSLTVVVESQAPPAAPPPYTGPPPVAPATPPVPPAYDGPPPPVPAPPAPAAASPFAPPAASPPTPSAPPAPERGGQPAPAYGQPPGASGGGPGGRADDAGLGFEPTYVLAGPVPGAFPGQVQPRSGPDLLVEVEGQEHRYRHPDQVTIGRLPDSSIVVTDPVASRMHLRVDATAGGWGFTNLSREGTFSAGRRVESEMFTDELVLRLGHPTAGPELRLVPVLSSEEEQARLATKRRRRTLTVVGAAAAAVVLVAALVGGAVALLGGDDDPAPVADPQADVAAQLDQAKAKTVRISYEVETYDGQSGLVTGSGSIISADGLILTNAHVADPQAEGLDEIYGEAPPFDSPDYVDVSLTDPDEDFRIDDPSYRARVVESDGDADAAVVEIYADADGNEVDPADLDLPFYEVGSSDDLATGDSITVLGFPGIASLSDIDPTEARPEVTVTTGVISTFIDTQRLGERSEIDTDARISQGNSGGSALNADFQLIGVPSATVSTDDAAGSSGRIRPVGVLADLISTSVEESGRG